MLLTENKNLVTLEQPWLNNAVGISCIPESHYFVKRNVTGRSRYYEVQNVQGHTHIELHPASFVISPSSGTPACCSDHYASTCGGKTAYNRLLQLGLVTGDPAVTSISDYITPIN